MTSAKKILANRQNAKKCTGPKTARGKELASLNALKHGLYANTRLILGEDEKEYNKIASQVLTETNPKTSIERVLVDQIIGDMWRLCRIERAEHAFFVEVQHNAFHKLAQTMSLEELNRFKKTIEEMSPEGDRENPLSRNPCPEKTYEEKIVEGLDPAKVLLEGMAAPTREHPYLTFENMRRTLMRDILQKYGNLLELQSQRLTVDTTPP